MIQIFYYTFSIFLLVVIYPLHGQDVDKKKVLVRIEQKDIMSGKVGIYKVKGKRVKRLIRHSERIVLPKLQPVFLSNHDIDSVDKYITAIIDNLDNDRAYADATILDGWDWTITIKRDSKDYKYTFSNCSCIYLDKLIKYLNQKLNKKALIYPMDYMGENNCCA